MVISHNHKQRPKTCVKNRLVGTASRRNYAVEIKDIAEALITSGFTSLDKQARALGINRSTAWTIIKAKHKLGRLSAKTSRRILASPELPPLVCAVVQRYLMERSAPLRRPAQTLRTHTSTTRLPNGAQ